VGTGAPQDSTGICQEPGDQGVLEVAEDAGLLPGRGLREAGVVQVADETLEPRNGAGRGQRLVGEVAFMVFQWGVGVADGHQDEEEKERPQQLHQELDRLSPAIQEILPKQQH